MNSNQVYRFGRKVKFKKSGEGGQKWEFPISQVWDIPGLPHSYLSLLAQE